MPNIAQDEQGSGPALLQCAIPQDLMRRVRVRAAERGERAIKHVVAEALEKFLESAKGSKR